MTRTVATLGVGLAIAVGTSGCGLSSSSHPAPAPPMPSAAHLLRRSERALARTRSVSIAVAVRTRHRPTFVSTEQVRAGGGLQVSLHGKTVAVQVRIIGHVAYEDLQVIGDLGNTLTSLGRSTGAGRWYRFTAPPVFESLLRDDRPAVLATCDLGVDVGRLKRTATATTFDGMAADVIKVDQGAAGTVHVTVAADPPYLPLEVTRTGEHPGPGMRPWIDQFTRAGCDAETNVLQKLATTTHDSSAKTTRTTLTFGQYDEPGRLPVPHGARTIPLTAADLHQIAAAL